MHVAIPFVGLGFLDNVLMLTAGDAIDESRLRAEEGKAGGTAPYRKATKRSSTRFAHQPQHVAKAPSSECLTSRNLCDRALVHREGRSLGRMFVLSTLACAGLGNAVGDVAGTFFGQAVRGAPRTTQYVRRWGRFEK